MNRHEEAADLDGFAQRLKALRRQKKLSQTELGQLAEMAFTQVSRYERGITHPTTDALRRLAQALGVSVGDLMDGTPSTGFVKPEEQEIFRRLRLIEKLPPEDKDAVMKLLDAFLIRKQVQDLATSS